MADLSKADKIAAGYKKLKEFQQKSRKSEPKPKKVEENTENETSNDLNVTAPQENFTTNGNNVFTTSPEAFFDEAFSPNQEHSTQNPNTNFLNFDKIVYEDNVAPTSAPQTLPSITSYFSDINAQQDFTNNFDQVLSQPISVNSQLINIVDDPIPTENVIPNQQEVTVPDSVPIELSSVENIRQLSTEINKYMESNDSITFLESTQNVLEKRNQELASIVENQRIDISHLSQNRQEYLDRIQTLETQLHAMQSEMTIKVQQEIRPLQEQLEYHAKTTGILVGERSELTAALEKSQAIIKEKISENEEIQCKLRASRHRVGDLERELANIKTELDTRIQSQTIENVDMLKHDLVQSKSRIEELTEDIAELTQKLNTQSQENVTLKQDLADKTNRLSLTELKLHQICNNETSQLELQVDTLNKEKLAMELKINHLAEELKSISLEKEKTNEQYQQYVQQLNEQIKQFSHAHETITKENERLQKRENELVTHMGNLEKDIQTLHKQKTPVKDLTEIQMRIASLDQLIMEKNKENGKLLEEKKDLLTELEVRNQHINQLEERMNDLENDKPNATRLVAAMESDKAAAAQAIKQNKKLTEQVMELQDKFVEFTQKELTLTEKLESEQHLGQEILKKLKASENEIEELKQQLNENKAKAVELTSLNSTPAISETLPSPPVNIDEALTISNVEISPPVIENISSENSALNTAAEHHQCEKCQMIEDHYEKVKAMEQLEERFKRIMDEVARLTEEKLELEHLVLQLQSETETIGEYVALYQFQRGVLKQRSQEKDEELRLLNCDREHMKQKLNELNSLVQQFVSEKISPSVLIEECQKFNKDAEISEQPENVKRADKIMELISEINSSNLIEPKDSVAHVCPLCSGQLITV